MNDSSYKLKKKREHNRFQKYTIRIFLITLMVIGFLGLLIPLRPRESAIEKRTLTKFPKPTVKTVMNGEFTDQISTWYADSFPFREEFMALNSKFERLYGMSAEEIHGGTVVSDEIPVDGKMESTLSKDDKKSSKKSKTDDEDEGRNDKAELHVEPEQAGTVYIADDRAFELYGFDAQGATNYSAMLNEVAKELKGTSTVYDILAPTSIAVMLDDEMQKKVGSSSQEEAFQYIEDNLDKKVKFVPVLDTLKKHNSEYLYFKTDHHWTADAAYYAYKQLMKEKGEKASPLKDYTKEEFTGFLGSFYSSSNQSEVLANNPDTVTAYVPEVNELTYTDYNGQEQQGEVVADANAYSQENKYLCFIAGDEPFEKIENPNIKDDSSCVVIKESYANAFVPFLVNSYHDVYVVDYRYYGGGLTDFVKENKIQDVIFLNNAHAINTKAVNLMYSIW